MVLALQRATHHTLRALSAALADLNLSAAEINALANLGEGGALNVRQLSERTGTRASTRAATSWPAPVSGSRNERRSAGSSSLAR